MPAEVPTIEEVRAVVREELDRYLAEPETGGCDRWKRIKKAAEYVGVSDTTLRGWIQRGRIPYVKMSAFTIALDVHDLDAFMEQNKVNPGNQPDEISRHRRIS